QRLTGDDAKQDQTQFKLLVKQMIVELEDVLRVLKT
ncbi:MAG: MerR family transcriptional regulator, partial [Pseudomonadota bacterium]